MKLIYRPFGIIIGLIAGMTAKRLFNFAWSRVDDEEAPKPTVEGSGWPKVMIAAAIQGIVFQTTKAAINRGGAEGFQYLTGVWPGKKRPDPKP